MCVFQNALIGLRNQIQLNFIKVDIFETLLVLGLNHIQRDSIYFLSVSTQLQYITSINIRCISIIYSDIT